MNESTIFAQRMKEAREKCGLKQKELAEMVGVTPQTISAYEKTGKAPTLDNAVSIANALGISLDWLASGQDAQALKQKTVMDYISALLESIDNLGLLFTEDEDWNGNPSGRYIVRIENKNLRGFNDLISDLAKLRNVRSVLDPDDYKTLVQKRISARASESNNFEKVPTEEVSSTVQEIDDDRLPF